MSALHLGASSRQAVPGEAGQQGRQGRQIKGGWREEAVLSATDLRNYPRALLPESKCDPIEIIAYRKRRREPRVAVPRLGDLQKTDVDSELDV